MSRTPGFINRWRHRRGFGVHSPLAFRVVKDILWPSKGYAYYIERTIRRLALPELAEPLLRAYRLGAMMNLRVEVSGELSPALRKIFPYPTDQTATRVLLILDPTPERLLLEPALLPDQTLRDASSGICPELLTRMVGEGGVLFVHSGGRHPEPATLPGELLFLLPDGWIAFSRPGVPRNCYDF